MINKQQVKEAVEVLKRVKEDYQPEIYAKETYNRRMAVQLAIDLAQAYLNGEIGVPMQDFQDASNMRIKAEQEITRLRSQLERIRDICVESNGLGERMIIDIVTKALEDK